MEFWTSRHTAELMVHSLERRRTRAALHARHAGTAVGMLTGLLLTVLAQTPANAVTSIRSIEWPLDSTHFQADATWRISRGEGVTVAVIDSGVHAGHPDLRGQVLPGTSELGDQHDDGTTDTSADSHGTAIAGIIAGTGKADNGTGMTGLAPAAKILPVRVALGATVQPTALAEGIKYAADHHAQVINISLGTPDPDPLLREAVNYALAKDAVLVASAGNDGQNGNPAQYPAVFPGVIDVTGVTRSGDFWPVSESGPHSTLAAPATDIYSTNAHDEYVHADGTSYAAAYVSAAAALVRAANPQLTAGQTIRRLISTARQPNGRAGHSDQYGYGLLNALAALKAPTSLDGPAANPLLAPAAATAQAPRHDHSAWLWITLGSGIALAAALGAIATVVVRQRRGTGSRGDGKPRPSSTGTSGSSKKAPKRQRRPDRNAKAGKQRFAVDAPKKKNRPNSARR